MKSRHKLTPHKLTWWIVLLAAGVFAVTLALPGSVAAGLLYIVVVLASLRARNHGLTIAAALACSLLILVDLYVDMFGPNSGHADWLSTWLNSVYVVAAVWTTAVLGTRILVLEVLLSRSPIGSRLNEERKAQETTSQMQGEDKPPSDSDRSADDSVRRRRTDQVLRDAENLLASLVENLEVHVLRKDAKGRFTYASPAVCNSLGKPLMEVLGRTDFDFYPPALAEKYQANDQMVMQSGQVFEDVEEHQTPNGGKYYVEVIKTPVRDAEGRVIGVQAIFWDVTDRKRAELLLRESELRKGLIFETAMDCIIFTDENQRVVEFNRAAERTFGYSQREAVGRDVAELIVPPGDRRRFHENIARFAGTGEMGSLLARRVELSLLRRDGETFLAELVIQPIPLDGAAAFAIFARDITDRKRAEAALRQAREAAEDASAAKSRFLANMSHEIRTPMNAIIGIADLLLNTELSCEQREYLTMLLESGESLLSLMNDMLDLSKIESGKLELDRVEFDFRERLGDAVKSLAFRAHGKGLELACHIAPEVPEMVLGDPMRLRQIVVNLLGNAIKFTELGEVLLDVQCQSQGDSDVVLRFAVKDTGVGIPQNKLERIFRAFEQADVSTARRFGGTGLGLAITSRLVEQMGGKIWVDSCEGEGSTFHFTARFTLPPRAAAARTRSLPQTYIVGLRVLVVDDHATSRGILEEMLRNWDLQPTAVAGPAEAERLLDAAHAQGRPYPVMILDANLPDGDSFAFAERACAAGRQATAVIMLLGSGNRPGDIARCERLGVAAYLIKPVKQSELLDTILAIVNPDKIEEECAEDAEAPAEIGPLRILLAEDTLINQRLAIGLLEQMGHTVVAANNGLEVFTALNKAADEHREFDLVLMDVQMPEMDGLEATVKIREREQGAGGHLPIVAMTARAMKGDRERCLAAGMDGYLTKPVRAKELRAAIRAVMIGPASGSYTSADDTDGRARETGLSSPCVSGVDWAAARKAVGDDERLLRLVVEASLEEYPRLIAELRQAVERLDAVAVARAAHAIKGSIRNFGATWAFELAYQLEELGNRGTLVGAAELLASIEQEFVQLLAELAEYIGKKK